MPPSPWGFMRTKCNCGGSVLCTPGTGKAHEGVATNILSEVKVQLLGQGVRGPPLPLLHKSSGGYNLETLDLDSRLAVGPKVALADDYGLGAGGNSTQFVSMELGRRILKTEELQKPEKLNI